MVGVIGPVETTPKEELVDRATIHVNIQPATGQVSNSDAQLEYMLDKSLQSVICTALAPRCAVQLDVQVLQSDGSLFASLLNASCLALLDAGVQCNSTVAAVTIAAMADGALIIDPDAKEESVAKALVTLAFSSTSTDIVYSHTRGVLTPDFYFACVELAQKACSKIHSFFRLTIERRMNK
jgi:exosome complex component RRP46